MYRADSFRDYDPTDTAGETRTFDQYKRELSGDLDASGNPIRLDNSGLSVWGARIGDGDPSDYEVTPVTEQYGLQCLFDSLGGVYTGFADLDYLYNSVPHGASRVHVRYRLLGHHAGYQCPWDCFCYRVGQGDVHEYRPRAVVGGHGLCPWGRTRFLHRVFGEWVRCQCCRGLYLVSASPRA